MYYARRCGSTGAWPPWPAYPPIDMYYTYIYIHNMIYIIYT